MCTNEMSAEYIQLYPNPVQNQLWLEFNSNNSSVYNLRVVDARGQIVLDETVLPKPRRSVDKSAFADGLYFISVTSGNETFTKSFIVEK